MSLYMYIGGNPALPPSVNTRIILSIPASRMLRTRNDAHSHVSRNYQEQIMNVISRRGTHELNYNNMAAAKRALHGIYYLAVSAKIYKRI